MSDNLHYPKSIPSACGFALGMLLVAGAMMLASCMAMGKRQEPPSPDVVHQPSTQAAIASDPTMEAAIEMIFDSKYAEAAKLLEQLVAGYEAAKEPRHASESVFWLGYCKEKSGNPGEAAKHYRHVMDKYPQTEAARKAQDRLDGLGPQP